MIQNDLADGPSTKWFVDGALIASSETAETAEVARLEVLPGKTFLPCFSTTGSFRVSSFELGV